MRYSAADFLYLCMDKIKSIVVFCASNLGRSALYEEYAKHVGTLLCNEEFVLFTAVVALG